MHQAQRIYTWIAVKIHGYPDPYKNYNPIYCSFASFEYYKNALSYFMPALVFASLVLGMS
jgi:hypothetical protein